MHGTNNNYLLKWYYPFLIIHYIQEKQKIKCRCCCHCCMPRLGMQDRRNSPAIVCERYGTHAAATYGLSAATYGLYRCANVFFGLGFCNGRDSFAIIANAVVLLCTNRRIPRILKPIASRQLHDYEQDQANWARYCYYDLVLRSIEVRAVSPVYYSFAS